jgi:tetratricopeptide (TPR) repeat protein
VTRPRTVCAAFAAALLAAACDEFAEGERAYREGRFDEARAAFARAEDAAGSRAGAEVAYDRALAALRAGDLRDAEASVTRAESRGGPEFASTAAFLRGNVAFARADLAAIQADTPEAEPFAWDVAILQVENARRAWQIALTERPDRADWPEARRNVERALLRAAEFREKKAEAEKRRQRRSDPKPKPKPRPSPKEPDRPETGNDAAKAKGGELSPEEVAKLLDKLAEKEREKLALRRSHREAQPSGVEKDW